jgi:hypothetical protein
MRSLYIQPPREDDEDRIHIVKGLKATLNEYNVAKALDTMDLDYNFQMTTGSKGQSFVVILDFLVFTVPQPTPLWVHGEHWHMGDKRAKDIRQMTVVDDFLGGAASDPVEIWGDQSKTYEQALLHVRKALR